MKKVYRIKKDGLRRPISIIADGCKVDERTGLLQVYDIVGTVGSGEDKGRQLIETLFAAPGGRWAWIRKVDEVE